MKRLALYRENEDGGRTTSPIAVVRVADSWWERLRGLLFRPRLAEGEGLVLRPCRSVHTIGMQYALDLLFLDRDGNVVRFVERLRPYRSAGARGAHLTVELPPGTIAKHALATGDRIKCKEVSK